jgi:cytochrome c-type biogenesis protein CcmH/NrfG
LRYGIPGRLAANSSFSDAVRLGTGSTAAYYDLALTDLELGRREEAVAALHMVLAINPGDSAGLALLQQINAT